MIKFASNNLTQWLLSHCHCHLLPSLQWMLVSKTTSPCPSCTLTFQTDLCSGQFIIQLLLLVLKQNYLLSDVALIKPCQLIISQRSSLSLTPCMQPGKSLTVCLIHVKSIQQSYQKNSVSSFQKIQPTQQSSENVLVILISISTRLLTVNQRLLILLLYSHAKCFGIITRKLNMMIFFKTGK